jgi:hypothetical protein
MRKHAVIVLIGILIVILSIVQVILPITPYVLPPCNLPSEPTHERLFQALGGPPPPGAHIPLSGYYWLQSGQIAEGSSVWGNITFYYPRGISESSTRLLYVLLEREYRLITDFARVRELSAYTWSSGTHCCDNSTHFGWTDSFAFRSNETGSYVFVYQAQFAESLVVFLYDQTSIACLTIGGPVVGLIVVALGVVLDRKSRRHRM